MATTPAINNSTNNSTNPTATQPKESPRLQISDGKRARDIWLEGDGNGDPDPTVFEKHRYAHDGHPTWKIYCGDAPALRNGVLVEPPRFCYLDDAAAWRVLRWHKYSKPYKGRCWRFDFGSKGEVRPHRLNRGRPAYESGGGVAVDGQRAGRKAYVFSGAAVREDLETLAQVKRVGLLEHRSVKVPATVPGPGTRNVRESEKGPMAFGSSASGDGQPLAKKSRVETLLPGHDLASVVEGAADRQMPSSAMGVDKNMVQLVYYKELSKHLYALNKSAVAALDRIDKIDTLETELRHEVKNFEVERKGIQKRLSGIETMMKKENGVVWFEMVKFMAENAKDGEGSKGGDSRNGENGKGGEILKGDGSQNEENDDEAEMMEE